MSSTAFIFGRISPGTVIPYQTGFVYTVVDCNQNSYHIRNVTYESAVKAKSAMRVCVIAHNEKVAM